jgi:hypothetical protein
LEEEPAYINLVNQKSLIIPGDFQQSRIYQKILNLEMPPSSVLKTYTFDLDGLESLKTWIQAIDANPVVEPPFEIPTLPSSLPSSTSPLYCLNPLQSPPSLACVSGEINDVSRGICEQGDIACAIYTSKTPALPIYCHMDSLEMCRAEVTKIMTRYCPTDTDQNATAYHHTDIFLGTLNMVYGIANPVGVVVNFGLSCKHGYL